MNHPGDGPGAVREAEVWAKAHAVAEVQQWLADSAKPGHESDCVDLIGFIKWGFIYAFRWANEFARWKCTVTALHYMVGN